MCSTIHEMRNRLAVAIANIEACIDGKLKPNPDRLGDVLHALYEIDLLMNDVRAVDAAAVDVPSPPTDVPKNFKAPS